MLNSDETAHLGKAVSSGDTTKNPSGVVHMREYVGAMSAELARMARGQGDEKLASILEIASDVAMNRTLGTIG